MPVRFRSGYVLSTCYTCEDPPNRETWTFTANSVVGIELTTGDISGCSVELTHKINKSKGADDIRVVDVFPLSGWCKQLGIAKEYYCQRQMFSVDTTGEQKWTFELYSVVVGANVTCDAYTTYY